MIGAIATGCAIGGLLQASKEFCKIAFDIQKKNKKISVSKDTWDNIWKLNNIFVSLDGNEISTPILKDIETSMNEEEYKFLLPLGITTKDIEKCKLQIQELCNANEVEITYCKDRMVSIKVIRVKEIKVFEGSIKTDKWNELWKELDIVTGNHHDSYKYPILILEKDIVGGKSYTFKLPIGKSTSHIKKERITIMEFLEARSIEVIPLKENTIEIKATFEELPKMIPFELIPRSCKNSFEVTIGKYIDGIATLNFSSVANVLNAGMQGAGKSIATKVALTYMACMYGLDEVDIYISDLKKTELGAFKRLKHVKKYVTNVSDTDDMIKDLLEIMNERYNLFEKVGVSEIEEYNKKFPQSKLKYIFVVLEEMTRFTTADLSPGSYKNKNTPDQNKRLSELLFLARASGMSVWCTVQRPTKDNLSQDAKSSMGNTLGFKTKDKLNSLIICDDEDGKLKDLRGKGHGYIITEKSDKEFQGFFITNDEITALLEERNLLKETESELNNVLDFEREIAIGLIK